MEKLLTQLLLDPEFAKTVCTCQNPAVNPVECPLHGRNGTVKVMFTTWKPAP